MWLSNKAVTKPPAIAVSINRSTQAHPPSNRINSSSSLKRRIVQAAPKTPPITTATTRATTTGVCAARIQIRTWLKWSTRRKRRPIVVNMIATCTDVNVWPFYNPILFKGDTTATNIPMVKLAKIANGTTDPAAGARAAPP